MRIFLSYASEDKDAAEQIYLILVKSNHRVFFDRTEQPPGDDYNSKIRMAINKCELFIFLISPDSVAKSSYALTELRILREQWKHPEGHVLPVMVRETIYDLIPPYLKAVSILEPEGNTAAEVSRQVDNWRHGRNISSRLMIIALALLISLTGAIWVYNHYFRNQPGKQQQPQPNLAVLDPGFVRFKGSLNRDHIIDPLRELLRNQGLTSPEASRDSELTETSIEYYNIDHREAAEHLAQVVGQYFTDKGYNLQFKVSYSASHRSSNGGANVVISIYLQ